MSHFPPAMMPQYGNPYLMQQPQYGAPNSGAPLIGMLNVFVPPGSGFQGQGMSQMPMMGNPNFGHFPPSPQMASPQPQFGPQLFPMNFPPLPPSASHGLPPMGHFPGMPLPATRPAGGNQNPFMPMMSMFSMLMSLATLEDQEDRHASEVDEINNNHKKETDKLKDNHKTEIDDINKKHAAEIEKLREQNQKAIDKIKADNAKQIKNLKNLSQAEINKNYKENSEQLVDLVNENLENNYFTDAELAEMIRTGATTSANRSKILAASDSKPHLISNKRYNLAELKAACPELASTLPNAPLNDDPKKGNANPVRNFLLGEAQNTLDMIKTLKEHKAQPGVTDRSCDAQIDATIAKLEERLKNTLKAVKNQGSPIALDLDGDGKISTSSAENGVNFDLNGDGTKDQISWVSSNDGFLVMDRNGNGDIDSGKELFGDQHGAKNGYEELKKLDSNNDGKIDSKDSAYSNLKVWQDKNQNGKVDDGELKSLADLKIASLSVNYNTNNNFTDENGVDHREQSTFTRTDGTTGKTVDVWFEVD